jgi:hypothetical protein
LKLTLNDFAGTAATLDVNRVCDGESMLIRNHGIAVTDKVSNGFKRLFTGLEIKLMVKD